MPFAQAAHSGETVVPEGRPNTVAPPAFFACPSAMPRAETTGRRLTEAMATEALSMMRLMIISAVSFGTATLSVATAAIFQASWSSRFSSAFEGWTFTSCICMGVFLSVTRPPLSRRRARASIPIGAGFP